MFLRRRMAQSTVQVPESMSPEANSNVDIGPLADRLGYALRRAQVAVFRDFFSAFEPYDIKPAQYSILTVIERNPGLKQTQISDTLGIKRTNFVAMIDELESRGLVRRDEAPGDRRSYALVLTAQGEALIPKLHASSEQHELQITTALGAGQRETVTVALHALVAHFEGIAPKE